MEDEITIKKVSSVFFKDEYFAERPACERLVNKRLDDLGIKLMRHWKEALTEYLLNYYPEHLNVKS